MSERFTGVATESGSETDALLRIDPTVFETLSVSVGGSDPSRILQWLDTWAQGR